MAHQPLEWDVKNGVLLGWKQPVLLREVGYVCKIYM